MTEIEPIRILMGSDFHFGAKAINQAEMAEAFASTIFPLLPETDILCLNGDFFDDVVDFNHYNFDPIYRLVMELYYLCEKHNVILRLLQGTWSHDRNQIKRLVNFYENATVKFDFKFHEFIDLEEITVRDRSLRFFFVRDNLPFKTADEVLEVIEAKMLEKGWDYLDYGCMHGFFNFTYPEMLNPNNAIVFKESQFPFVKKAINVGHVHDHRVSENTFSNGSFDRLCHGEENSKGCIRYLDYPTHYKAFFVENKEAAIYKTLKFEKDVTTEQISKSLDDYISGLDTKREINIRLEMSNSEVYGAAKSYLREFHPNVTVKRKKIEDGEHVVNIADTTDLLEDRQKRDIPTRSTLSMFIRNHIAEEYKLSVGSIETYLYRNQNG